MPTAGAFLHVTIERTTSSHNATRGISAIGGISTTVVTDSTITHNGDTAVEVSEGATVILSRNTIASNGEIGIYNAGSTVKTSGDNVLSDNAGGDVSGTLTPLFLR